MYPTPDRVRARLASEITWKESITWAALGNTTLNTAAEVADVSRAPWRTCCFQAAGRLSKNICHVNEMTGGQVVDDPVMLDIAGRRHITGVGVGEPGEAGLVQPDREPFTVRRQSADP